MKLNQEHIGQYAKFLSFILKYSNSEVFNAASDNVFEALPSDSGSVDDKYSPEELLGDLKKMGPTYVKIGQALSTRPDLLPENYLEALATLQDDVDEMPYSEVEQLVQEELGVRMSKAFQSFDVKPMASASIGQVHRAVLPSGKEVAVKVQRNGIREQFVKDISSLREMASVAVNISGNARKYAVDEVIDEMSYMLLNELDYGKEAENLVTIHENLKDYHHIVIPQPVNGYCSTKILTMDYIEGTKVTSLSKYNLLENDYKPLVDEFLEAYLKQITVDGFAHADPHPGNVYITNDKKLAMLDLGMVAKFGSELQENILKLLIALSKYDGAETSRVVLGMSRFDKAADTEGFAREVNRLVLDSRNKKAAAMNNGRMIIQMNKLAADKGILIAPEINVLGKILLNMDQIVAFLTPDYDVQKIIERSVQKLMTLKMAEKMKPQNLFSQVLEAKTLAERMPERLNKITEALANNQFEIKVNAIDEQRFTDGFQKVANRISLGLIIAALIIGSALLMRIPTSFTIAGYPAIAMIFFITAAVIGIWLAVKMILKDDDFKLNK